MTQFFDPLRPTDSEGLPCWLGTRFALPGLVLRPKPEGWGLTLALPSPYASNAFSYAEALVSDSDLPLVLSDWVSNPEEALRRHWKREPPEAKAQGPTQSPSFDPADEKRSLVSEKTAEDLGL